MTTKEQAAGIIHATINGAYWAENQDWESDNALSRAISDVIKSSPVSPYSTLKKLLLNNPEAIVNGESIVVPDGEYVQKHMFRRPKHLGIDEFRDKAEEEISQVTSYLGGIALLTEVSIQKADIFRWPLGSVDAVTQTQPRLDLEKHLALKVDEIDKYATDKTAHDLDTMLAGIELMTAEQGLLPDLGQSSGNLRINREDGSVVLIDVMPIYSNNGQRLIGDGAEIINGPEYTIKGLGEYALGLHRQ